jgi:hypothetical protein
MAEGLAWIARHKESITQLSIVEEKRRGSIDTVWQKRLKRHDQEARSIWKGMRVRIVRLWKEFIYIYSDRLGLRRRHCSL